MATAGPPGVPAVLVVDTFGSAAVGPWVLRPEDHPGVKTPYFGGSKRKRPHAAAELADHEARLKRDAALAALQIAASSSQALCWSGGSGGDGGGGGGGAASAGSTDGSIRQAREQAAEQLRTFSDLIGGQQQSGRDSGTGQGPHHHRAVVDCSVFATSPHLSDLCFGNLVTNNQSGDDGDDDDDEDSKHAILFHLLGREYIVPRDSAFVLGDMAGWGDALAARTGAGTYGLVVVDPPWPSKSVTRARAYDTLSDPASQLVGQRTAAAAGGGDGRNGGFIGGLGGLADRCFEDGALVCVWVTNDPKIRRLVQTALFAAWDVEFCGVWYWVKVTNDGQRLVCPLDSVHRKPYEALVVGRRRRRQRTRLHSDKTNDEQKEEEEQGVELLGNCTSRAKGAAAGQKVASSSGGAVTAAAAAAAATAAAAAAMAAAAAARSATTELPAAWEPPPVPAHRTIVGVPLRHSAKPPVDALCDPLLPRPGSTRKLELFARNLRPGWTSCGNEVLKFMDSEYYYYRHDCGEDSSSAASKRIAAAGATQ